MLDQARSAQGKSDPRLSGISATFALRWSSMISHVEQRSSRRESWGWFFFLSRVVWQRWIMTWFPKFCSWTNYIKSIVYSILRARKCLWWHELVYKNSLEGRSQGKQWSLVMPTMENSAKKRMMSSVSVTRSSTAQGWLSDKCTAKYMWP